jgi:hypothetical protein
MTIFRSDDLPIFFDAFGVVVQFNGTSANGILDSGNQIVLADHGFGGIEADKPTIKIPGNAFNPMPTTGDNLTVDGDEYTVASFTNDTDGAIWSYALKEAR